MDVWVDGLMDTCVGNEWVMDEGLLATEQSLCKYLYKYFILCARLFCTLCLRTTCLPGAPGSQKKTSDLLELKL